jgi:hypothetical protein
MRRTGYTGYIVHPDNERLAGNEPESPDLFGLFKALGKKAVEWTVKGFIEMGKGFVSVESAGETPGAAPQATEAPEAAVPVEAALGDFGELRVGDFAAALGQIEDPADLLIYLEEQK